MLASVPGRRTNVASRTASTNLAVRIKSRDISSSRAFTSGRASHSGEAALGSVGGDWVRNDPALAPRKPTPKTPTAQLRIPEDATGKLIIKFRDEVKARPTADGTVRSLTNGNLDEVQAIIDQFEVRLSRLINHPDSKLAELEARAATYSGKAQPDLAGMMYIQGPQEKLQGAARALNELQTVEWVIFEVKKYPFGGLTGACCVPDLGQCVDDLTLAQCTEFGGAYQGNGTLCEDIDCMFPGACCVGDDCADGLTEETCQAFGAGYAPKGIMRGRLAIPIHDWGGALVAYCGRAVEDESPTLILTALNVWIWHNPDLPGPAAVRQLSPQTRTFAPGKSASPGRGWSAAQASDGLAGRAADPTPWGPPDPAPVFVI